jgi:two-component system chemotaxis response regulator CheB
METTNQMTPVPWLITIAASAGGVEALQRVLRALPPDLPGSIVVLQHRTPGSPSNNFRRILSRASAMPVDVAEDDHAIEPGHVYIARADLHLTISPARRFSYVDGTRIQFLLSSANPLFASAAAVFKSRVIAVVLTGGGSDAADGVQSVKASGGLVIAQDPATALHRGMPQAAVASGAVDLVLPLDAIAPALNAIVHGQPVPNRFESV